MLTIRITYVYPKEKYVLYRPGKKLVVSAINTSITHCIIKDGTVGFLSGLD